MRNRFSDSQYAGFVAFPGLTLGVVVILIDGLLGNPAKLDHSERIKAGETSFAQLASSDHEELWLDCTVVASKQQVDPPCE